MEYEKFEGKYIPKFKSEEQLQAAAVAKAVADYSMCTSCLCRDITCRLCILHDRDSCKAYLKHHHEHLDNSLKELSKTSKEKGEETMENDFPKLKPGMAITFTNNSSLGFMVSATQFMYVKYHCSGSVIVKDWDLLGDRVGTDVPYSRIEAVYATSDTDNVTKEPLESFIPYGLACMAEAVSNGEDLEGLDGVYLIWRRQEHKEMTVEEIEKELGYKIKIVGED